MGSVSSIDPDKVYDYHTAFNIHPTEVVFNVDINANQKNIRNIALDRNRDNSAATVGMVKELIHLPQIIFAGNTLMNSMTLMMRINIKYPQHPLELVLRV